MRFLSQIWTVVKRLFLAGLLVTLPLGVTLWTIQTLWGWIDSPLRKLFEKPAADATGTIAWVARQLYRTEVDWSNLAEIPGLGLFVVLLFILMVGVLTRSFVGGRIVRLGEVIVEKIPIVRTIYQGIKQLFETILASKEARFQEVVLVEYPRRGIYCVGFVTGRTVGEVQDVTPEETVNIFLPTTPNPTSGFLLMVPREDLIYLKMSVEDAVKLVISGGIVAPESGRPSPGGVAGRHGPESHSDPAPLSAPGQPAPVRVAPSPQRELPEAPSP